MKDQYEDIINLPHHVSKTRPQMSELERAAQFSPFAALTGYDTAVKETERLTDEKPELSEEAQAILDIKQKIILEHIKEKPEIRVTYFVSDNKKAGGGYVTVTGNVKRIDKYEHILVMTEGLKIPMNEITEIDSVLFRGTLYE